MIKGKKIDIETIDLSEDFQTIKSNLLSLADKQLGLD